MSNNFAPDEAGVNVPGSSDEPPGLKVLKSDPASLESMFQEALDKYIVDSCVSLKHIFKVDSIPQDILQGFIVTMTNDQHMTCLHLAVHFNDMELLSLLQLTFGPDLWEYCMNMVDGQKWTAFQWACVRSHTPIVNIMIESMNHRDIVRLISNTDDRNLSLLHYVCQKGSENIEHILFRCVDGDDVAKLMEIKGTDKRTAFHWVCLSGHHNIVKMITQKMSPKCRDDMVLATDENGATSLHMACQYNHVETVTELLLSLSSCTVRKYLHLEDVNGKTAFNLLDIEPMKKIISNICEFIEEDQLLPEDQLEVEVSSQNIENPKKMPDMWLITALCQNNRFGFSSFHGKDQIENNVKILNKYQQVYVQETRSLEEAFPDFFYFHDKGIKYRQVANLHPLSVLADAGHLELIMHPYLRIYADALWNRFARYFFYFALAHHLLLFICIAIFVATHHIPEVDITVGHHVTVDNSTMRYVMPYPNVTLACGYVAMALAGISLIFEIVQMTTKRWRYLTFRENWLDLLVCISTMCLILLPLIFEYGFEIHAFGTATMMLVGVMYFWLLSKTPTKLGYMFVMLTVVVVNVFHIIPVLCIPIMIFSLAFYNFLSHDPSFLEMDRSVISILSMSIGELNNIKIFQNAANTDLLSYIAFTLFILLLIIMTISGMNLLIGVAVGDITYLRERGKVTSFRSMVDLILQYSRVLSNLNKRIHRKSLGRLQSITCAKQSGTPSDDIKVFENYCFELESNYVLYYQKDEGYNEQSLLSLIEQHPKLRRARLGENALVPRRSSLGSPTSPLAMARVRNNSMT